MTKSTKSIGFLLSTVLGVVGIINFIWILATQGSSASVNFAIFLTAIALLIPFVLFIVYKLKDIKQHPEDRMQILLPIVIALGVFLFSTLISSSEGLTTAAGNIVPDGFLIKVIGGGIISAFILSVVSITLMIGLSIKNAIKG